jgi:predicted Zn-dependent protease
MMQVNVFPVSKDIELGQQFDNQNGVQDLLPMANGKLGATGTQIAGAVAGLGLLNYSRTDEQEADTYSFKYLQFTEYFPGASKYFFEKVAHGGKGGVFERLLSTHPLPQDRVDHIAQLLKDAGNPQAKEANLFATRYKKFKSTRRTIPVQCS